jgi:hypothetical protein
MLEIILSFLFNLNDVFFTDGREKLKPFSLLYWLMLVIMLLYLGIFGLFTYLILGIVTVLLKQFSFELFGIEFLLVMLTIFLGYRLLRLVHRSYWLTKSYWKTK